VIFRVLIGCGAPSVPQTPPPEAVEKAQPEDVLPLEAESSPGVVIEFPPANHTLEPGSMLTVMGTARIFEGQFEVKLLAGDELIGEQRVLMGSADGGTWAATFQVPEGQSGGPWKIQAYTRSAKDGSIEHLAEVPLTGP